MLLNIAWFEIRYWLRSWMLWIFILVIAALFFGAVSTDQVQVGGALSNTFRNAPFVIQNFYAMAGLLTLLMVTAFVNSAATRDFSQNTYQIVFSTPLRRRDFLLGRFFGATIVSVLPMLGVSVGILLAKYMPWVEPERWEAVIWSAHLKGILVFALPNTFFMAAIIFTIAVLVRNDIFAFVGALLLLVAYGTSQALMTNIERENIASLLDPFAIRTFSIATKYWTVADKNSLALGFGGMLLWNRVLWIVVGALFLAFACYRFSFAERRKKSRKRKEDESVDSLPVVLPEVRGHSTVWQMYWSSTKVHLSGILSNIVFIVVLLAGLVNCVPAIIFNAREGYGNSTLPVTYWVLEIINGTFYMFLIVLITYYAGVLIWKDRDTRMDEIADSLPTPEWVAYAARFTALAAMVMILQALALLSGIIVQASYGYHRFQLNLYFSQLFVHDLSFFIFLGGLAFFIHVFSPNKYVGYFAYIAFFILNVFIWRPLNISTNLVQFSSVPNMTYSDFFGDAPYISGWHWFTWYWLFFCGLLAVATVMFWPRGKQLTVGERWQVARLRFSRPWAATTMVLLVLFVATGGWICYNTKILNRLIGPKDQLKLQADYEKAYKQFDYKEFPRIRSDKYTVDIYPESRNVNIRVDEVINNPYPHPLDEIHYTTDVRYDTDISRSPALH